MSEKFEQPIQSSEKEAQPMRVFVEVGTNQLPVTFVGERRFEGENDMYIGIDVKKEEIVSAKQAHGFGPEGQHATFVQASAEKLPLKDESTNEMFFGNVFGDPSIGVQAKSAFLREAERVLKLGGQLIIKETNTPLDIEKLRKLLVGHSFHEERMLTRADNNWQEELQHYEKFGFNSPDAYLVYLKKMAAQQ